MTIEDKSLQKVAADLGLPDITSFLRKGWMSTCDPRLVAERQVLLDLLCRVVEHANLYLADRAVRHEVKWVFSISPIKYLKYHRLQAAGAKLLRPGNVRMSIGDVANMFGFRHMGQFGVDYRHLVGELPSDTRNRYLQKRVPSRIN